MNDDRHVDELISASLSGDLSEREQLQLEHHLRGCADCRATLAAFGDQRRLVGGLRHVGPPRDLPARVRSGIEAGAFAPVPWWRRPSTAFAGLAGAAAVVAGAVLGLAVLSSTPEEPPVGASDSPAPTPSATLSASPTPEPAVTPAPTATPTPAPTPTPEVIGFGTVNYLSVDGPLAEQQLWLNGYDPATGEETQILRLDSRVEAPITASFSPDYEWLVYQTDATPEGRREIWAVNLLDGNEYLLGHAPGGDPFAKQMSWSVDSQYLAYTAVTDGGVDAHLFDTAAPNEPRRLTDLGTTYAGSFDDERLWLSVAGEQPISHLVPLDADLSDLAAAQVQRIDGFQPLLSPDGTRVIFWTGTMEEQPDGSWLFANAGMPHLASGKDPGQIDAAQPLFPTLPVDRDAFVSAEIAWGYDSDSFAVWNAAWTGLPQPDSGGNEFPSGVELYLGRAETGDLIEPDDGLNFAAPDERVVDVEFIGEAGFDGRPNIAVTVFEAAGGESGDAPSPQGRLILSPPGGNDAAAEIASEADWAGPALYIVQPGDLLE